MMSAQFEISPHKSSSLSNQYANVQVALSASGGGGGGNNQYGVKPSTNYSSPIDVPVPTSDAHYKEFLGAKQLMEMNQQTATNDVVQK